MAYLLFVDSTTGISLDPEYDFKNSGEKFESRHRARSGKEYVYKWGEYTKISFSLMYLSSSDMSTLNDWWSNNTPLLFMKEGASSVTSVHIINKKKPIDSFIKPYDDLYQGKIELGTY